jgi:hypothetical protein
MVRALGWLALLALLAGPAGAGEEKTYALKLKQLAAGDAHRVEKTEESSAEVVLADAAGKVLQEDSEKGGHAYVYRETILEKPEGEPRATRLKRHYEKASLTVKGKPVTLPLEGKTVLIEKKGARFTFRTQNGEPLSAEVARPLDLEFNKKKRDQEAFEKLFLPKRPVKVGETWEVERAVVNKGLQQDRDMEISADKTKASATLKRVYRKDGRQFGVLVLKLEVTPRAFHKGGKRLPVRPGAKLDLEITLDGCIDGGLATGSADIRLKMHAEAILSMPGQPKYLLKVRNTTAGSYRSVE